MEGRQPRFGPGDEVFFRHTEGASAFAYRVLPDGTGLRKAIPGPIVLILDVSPDGRWIEVWGQLPQNGPGTTQVVPLDGGRPVDVGPMAAWEWSRTGSNIVFGGGILEGDTTFIAELPPGQVIPRIPAGGFHFAKELSLLPGAHKVNAYWTVPGPTVDVYAFYRGSSQRNLYRIPIP